jgi:uncharacterized membrane protein
MVDLGPGVTSSVNTSGEVAGTVMVPLEPLRGFVWRDGVQTDLAFPADARAGVPDVINERGQVGGGLWYQTATGPRIQAAAFWSDPASPLIVEADPTLEQQGIRLLNGTGQAALFRLVQGGAPPNEQDRFWSATSGVVDIGDLGGGSHEIFDLNEAGTAVGWSLLPSGENHAVRWTLTDGLTDLGVLGRRSYATSINERDEIVGGEAGRPVKWIGGLIQNLDDAEGLAEDINNSGHAVGYRYVDGRAYATLWRDGVAIDLGAGAGSIAWTITDMDVVVGQSPDGPFVWTNPAEGAILLPVAAGTSPASYYTPHAAGNFIVGNAILDSGFPEALRWEVTVTPLSNDGPIGDLRDHVGGLAQTGAINRGEANALDAKLAAALVQCEHGNENAGRSQLEAFINHVRALMRAGQIDATTGQALIAEAETILAGPVCGA